MKHKTLYLFICVCVAFVAQTALILYLHEVLRSCDNGMKKEDLHLSFVPSKTKVQLVDMKRENDRQEQMETTVNFSSIMYFEPLVAYEFPTISSEYPRIPHIIHQTYSNERIPADLGKHVKTLVKNNPKWKFYFWTDEASRKFVAERFPTLLQMWDDYKSPINRADAIRYLVLYEFGGLYADLDVECKRPLDNLTMKYACIFPSEPFEQSVFRVHVPYLINNAILLCRPRHPFLKQIVNTLHQYQSMMEQIDIAGPSFVTSQFIRYNNITADQLYNLKQSNESNSPYFYKGELPEEDNDAVYVPNTQYFINSLSQNWMNEKDYKTICESRRRQNIVVKKACNELTRRLSQKDRVKYAFTDHHWFHSYSRTLRFKYKSYDKIVKNYLIY
ncbi:uncharacterized protein LOC123555316 [Mercenaria mercenaria]|uniref:uncharacterized protein LOC123555316 n=1 Tax=Mercenaria mercenaria TaxID=6596 RepID=UPI00234F49DE|nr:uncharacterized protein LOC123555316 [Mercenaria mercenaria]